MNYSNKISFSENRLLRKGLNHPRLQQIAQDVDRAGRGHLSAGEARIVLEEAKRLAKDKRAKGDLEKIYARYQSEISDVHETNVKAINSFWSEILGSGLETIHSINRLAIIEIPNAWVRSRPVDGKVINKFPKGAEVLVREKSPAYPDWYRITWGSDGEGWIRSDQLSIRKIKKMEKPKVVEVKRNPRVVESAEAAETPEWNRDIIPTFDDSLSNAFEVIKHLESKGIENYMFYGVAYMGVKNRVLADMGVDVKKHTSGKITPGKWLTEYVDHKRGALSRKEYIRQKMLKGPAEVQRGQPDYLALGKRIKEFYQKKYPSKWKQKLQEKFQYHASFLHPNPESQYHIQHWSQEQIIEDIQFYQEFIKAWLDIDEYVPSRFRTPQGGGFGFDANFYKGARYDVSNAPKLIAAAKAVNPRAEWDMWSADSFDASTRGGEHSIYGRTISATVRKAVGHTKIQDRAKIHPYLPKKSLVLFHTKYYGSREQLSRLDKFIDGISREYSKGKLLKYPAESQFSARLKVATVKVWSESGSLVEKLDSNSRFKVIGEKGIGYFVELSSGAKGLIAKKFVEKHESIASKYDLPSRIQGKEVVYKLGKWTPEKINNLIGRLKGRGQEERMRILYQDWQDVPYRKRLSGFNRAGMKYKIIEPYKNKLVIRLDAMDCTEFPIYALALIGAKDYEDFMQRLIKIKYKKGVIGDKQKLHYTFMRMQNWADQNLTKDLAGGLERAHLVEKDARMLTTVSNVQERTRKRFKYIPTARLDEAIKYLKTGDVFGFILSDGKNKRFGHDPDGTKREQIIGHMGFVWIEDGEAYFVHSNSSRYHNGAQAGISICEYWDSGRKKLRKGTKRPLKEYLRNNAGSYKGVMVMRPVLRS